MLTPRRETSPPNTHTASSTTSHPEAGSPQLRAGLSPSCPPTPQPDGSLLPLTSSPASAWAVPPQHLFLSGIFTCPAAGLQWASAPPWSTSSCDRGVPSAVSHFFSLPLFFQHFLPSPQHVSTEAPAALLTGSAAPCIPEPSRTTRNQLWWAWGNPDLS